jgi:hypothetical protein
MGIPILRILTLSAEGMRTLKREPPAHGPTDGQSHGATLQGSGSFGILGHFAASLEPGTTDLPSPESDARHDLAGSRDRPARRALDRRLVETSAGRADARPAGLEWTPPRGCQGLSRQVSGPPMDSQRRRRRGRGGCRAVCCHAPARRPRRRRSRAPRRHRGCRPVARARSRLTPHGPSR